MSNQPPLNPDASDQYEYRIDALIQRRAKGTDEDFQTFGLALTEDGREYLGESVDDLNSMVSTGLFEVVDGPIPGHCPNCSEKIAVALPEVTSVEVVPAKLQIISWEEEPEHECWKLAPDETFVGLIVKSGRSWTPRDKYTLNIERPEVKP